MGIFLGRMVLGVCLCMFLASAGHGRGVKTVYLKGGGIIECQKFWEADGKVKVIVNRDTYLEFTRDELDMKRTFRGHKPSKARKPAGKKKDGAAPSRLPAASRGDSPEGKAAPAGVPGVRQKAMSSAAKPAAGTMTKPAGHQGEGGKVSPVPKPGAAAPVAASSPKPAPQARAPIPVRPAAPEGAALAGMLGMGSLMPFLLILVLVIASLWRIFTKAGEAGWQCIIPLYNLFILVKISGKPWWWFLLLFIPVVNIIIAVLVHIALAERFNRGFLYGLGLAFLGFIFFPVLAFGNAEYQR